MPPVPPRLRRDLDATSIEADGVHYVDVSDPKTGRSFRFYDFEHAVALALDGRPLEQVGAELRESAGLDLTVDQLAAFADELHRLGFLAPPPSPPPDEMPTPALVPVQLRSAADAEGSDLPAVLPIEPVAPFPPALTPHPEPPAAPPPSAALDGAPTDPIGPPRLEAKAKGDAAAAREGEAEGTGPREADEPASPAAISTPTQTPTPFPAPPPAVAAEDEQRRPVLRLVASNPAPPLPPAPAPLPVAPPVQGAEREAGGRPPAAAGPAIPLPDLDEAPATATAEEATEQLDRTSGPRRVPLVLLALLAFFGAAGVVTFLALRLPVQTDPPAVGVRALQPSPTSVYRFFEGSGVVERAAASALAFPSAGRVIEIVAPGTRFEAGETLGLLEAARAVRRDLNHHRERLAYYTQMLETNRAAGDKVKARTAELKVAEKNRFIEQAKAALARFAIVPDAPGEVAEVLVAVGAEVAAGAPALRTKGSALRARIDLPRDDVRRVRQLGFCRAEIDGKPLSCTVAAGGGDDAHVVLELPPDPVVAVGKAVRLARARYDAAFVLPASTVVRVGDTERVYVAAPTGRAEARIVTLAEPRAEASGAEGAGGEVVVTQGLDVGDQVIVDPKGLRPDARVAVEEIVRSP